MSEHKHCGECKGCYGYHYPSCSKHSEDIECEFSVQHLQDDDYAQDLIAEIEANRATIATLTQERDTAQATAKWLAERCMDMDKTHGQRTDLWWIQQAQAEAKDEVTR